MKKNHYYTGSVSLSVFPKWFIEREDSLELIGMSFLKDDKISQSSYEECFESVFVICEKSEEEKNDSKEDVVEFTGFDTSAELCDHLTENSGKEVVFIYNTKNDSYYEYSIAAMIEKIKPEPGTEKGKGSDAEPTPAAAAGLPTVQKGASPGPLEARPGNFGPKRT